MSVSLVKGLDHTPESVLIIKPSALGDVVTALPVLRALRRKFPAAHLSWLVNTNCAALLEGDPDLDEIVPFARRKLGRAWRSPGAAAALGSLIHSLRHARYDWVIDLQGLFRSGFFARVTGASVRTGFANAREGAWMFYTHRLRPTREHTVDRNIELAEMLGLDARREDMTLHVPPKGKTFAEALRRRPEVADSPLVVFVPPTRWTTKLYPERHWRTLAGRLAASAGIAVMGTAADTELCSRVAEAGNDRAVSLAGQTDIAELVGVIASADCVVCCDSAAMHIAQAVGTDVVALIGPTRPERTGPVLGGQCIVAPVPCQGCLRKRCAHITCMQEIDPRTVAERVKQSLAGRRQSCRTDT